jgi:hypothetical protein
MASCESYVKLPKKCKRNRETLNSSAGPELQSDLLRGKILFGWKSVRAYLH